VSDFDELGQPLGPLGRPNEERLAEAMRRRGIEYEAPRPLHAMVEERISRDEQSFVDMPVEHGRVYDAAGNAIYRAVGREYTLSFGAPRADMKDRVVTHNHTNGTSFSAKDLARAGYFDVAELRIITRDATGQAWLYRLQRPERGWPRLKETSAQIYLAAGESAAAKRILGQGATSTDAVADFVNNAMHYRMEHVATHFGLSYTREKVDC